MAKRQKPKSKNVSNSDIMSEFEDALGESASDSDVNNASLHQEDEDIWLTKHLLTFSDFCESADHMNFPPLSDKQRRMAEYMFGTDPKKTFDNNRTLGVLVWGKGSGKDTISAMMQLYIVYLLLNMKYPQRFMGRPDSTTMDLINVAVSKEQAQTVYFSILKGFVIKWKWLQNKWNIVSAGRYFSSQADESIKPDQLDQVTITNDAMIFPKNIRCFSGSSESESLEGKCVIYFCFPGDTKISLVDGREMAIRDLVGLKQFWVYSYKDGKVIPALARAARKTRINADIVKVTLDDGAVIRCTPDHRFMLRDGSYREASGLSAGDSLMPLYRKKAVRELPGYELLYQPYDDAFHYTHREFWAYSNNSEKKQIPGHVIHHKNYNKNDNTPENLSLMRSGDHLRLHHVVNSDLGKKWWAEHPEERVKMSDRFRGRKLSDDTKKAISVANTGRKRSDKNIENFKKAAALRALDKSISQKISDSLTGKVRSKEHCKNLSNAKQLEIADLTPRQYYDRFATRTSKPPTADRLLDIEKTLNDKRKRLNHKVVSVVPDGIEDVYDITVDGTHNFALSAGVFVHNCLDEADAFKQDSLNRSAEKIYRVLRTSANSRFPGRFKSFVISYPRSKMGFVMKMYNETRDMLNVYGDIAPTWEVLPRKLFSTDTFQFEGQDIPMDMYEDFRLDPLGSKACYLCDPPDATTPFIEDYQKVDLAMHNIKPLFDFRDIEKDGFVRKAIIRAPFMYDRTIKHVLTFDLSEARDLTALSISHREDDNIIFDNIIYWTPDQRRKLRVDLSNVEEVITNITKDITVDKLLGDAWNSAMMVQKMRAAGINANIAKLDLEDYESFKRLLYAGHIKFPKNDRLMKELKNLQLVDGRKVDHLKGMHNDLSCTVVMAVKAITHIDGKFGSSNMLAEGEYVGENLSESVGDFDQIPYAPKDGIQIDGIPI